MGTHATPDDVRSASAKRWAVLPGGTPRRAGAHGPGQFVDAGESAEALDAEASTEVPASAQVLDEPGDGSTEEALLSGERRARSAVKRGRTS